MQSIRIWVFYVVLTLAAGDVFAQKAIITTAAGNGTEGFSGDGGPAVGAQILGPNDVAVDAQGNFYIADRDNHRIRRVAAGTGIITTVAGNGVPAFSGDNGPAVAASLNYPSGVAVDGAGNLYIADFGNGRIRRVAAGSGIITTLDVYQFYPMEFMPGANDPFWKRMENLLGVRLYKDGYALPITLNGPVAVAVDPADNVFVAEKIASNIRKVAPDTNFVTTVAGTGTAGFSGDGGKGDSAAINEPTDVLLDGSGNIYFADSGNNRIRRVAAGSGIISTVVGQLNRPGGVALDPQGNLLISDTLKQRVLRASPGSGSTTTLAGGGETGDGCSAATASLQTPRGLGVNSTGNLIYIADETAQRVRLVTLDTATSPPILTSIEPASGGAGTSTGITLAGSGFYGAAGTGPPSPCRTTTVSVSGSGITVSGVNVVSDTSLGATLAIAPGAAAGERDVTVITENGTSRAVKFTVLAGPTPPPTLTSITPATLSRGSSATLTLNGTNFDMQSGSTSIAAEGVAVSNVVVTSETALTAVFTAADDTTLGDYPVAVVTPMGSSDALPVAVVPQGPTLVYEMPATLQPTENTAVKVALAAPGPEPVTGVLTVAFESNASTNTDDPGVTLINSQTNARSAGVTFPVNTANGELSIPNSVLQAGTVAGRIRLTMTDVQVGGIAVTPVGETFDIDIPRLVPVITNVRILNRTSSGFDVEVTGYSTSREITGARFDFREAKGEHLVTVILEPDVASSFTTYYQSETSSSVGSTFLYVQPFFIQQGNVDAVGAVTVALSNTQGVSLPKSTDMR